MIVTDIEKLKQVSEPIDLKEVKDVLEKIKAEFKEAEKLAKENKTPMPMGLSAIQIGIKKRVAWISFKTEKESKDFALVNPEILKKEGIGVFRDEQCLSLPGESYNTRRYRKVYVQDDINGKRWYSGYAAIVVQHECDHFKGFLISDRKYVGNKVEGRKIGRNESCPCKSGKKFKHCCGK